MSSMFNNLISKIKLKKTLNNVDNINDYAFSMEEIDNLEKTNNKKIKDLKKNIIGIKDKDEVIITKKGNELIDLEEIENNEKDTNEKDDKQMWIDDESLSEIEEAQINEYLEEINKDENNDDEVSKKGIEYKKEENNKDSEAEESFVNLSKEHQDLIMQNWNDIDLNGIDKDIINGKDILNHNYNITYGDNAARFVHDVRKKYEIVICYLIGFNNEKKGIKNKTIFSDKVDNEWKYLENYIKLLEKIRNFRK